LNKIENNIFVFGIGCVLGTSLLGGHDFNAVLAWFALILVVFMHASAITSGAKLDLLNIVYYVICAIWFFGMICI
jgi:hypothetical protein